VVWCPPYRRKVLVAGVDTRLKAIIAAVCTERMAELCQYGRRRAAGDHQAAYRAPERRLNAPHA